MLTNNENQKKSDFIDIKPIINKGLRNWYVFIIMGALCGGAAILYYKLTKPTYKILTNVLIKEENESSMASMQAAMMKSVPFGSLLGSNMKVNDELELMHSFTVFRLMVKKLNLNETYELKKTFKNKVYYQDSPIRLIPETEIADTLDSTIKFSIDIDKSGAGHIKAYTGLFHTNRGEADFTKLPAILHTDFGSFTINATKFYKQEKTYEIKVIFSGYNSVAEYYQEKIDVEFVSKKANLIVFTAENNNKEKGRDMLNSLVEEYNRIGMDQRKDKATSTIALLNERIQIIANELASIENNLEVYKKKNDLTDIEAEVKAIFENSGDLRSRQIEVETQYTVIELIEDFLVKPENRYAQIPYNVGLTDRNVLEGLQKYNDALLERMKLQKQTHDNNPMVEIYNEQLDVMRNNMLITIKSLKTGFAFTRNDLKKQESYSQSRLKNMPTQEREFVEIKRQQYLKQELYMFLLQKKEENILAQSMPTPKAQVVDKAYHLSKPLKPKLLNNMIFAIGLSFILSILWINRNSKRIN